MYKLFKTQFAVEKYCKIILPPRHRAAFSKFRCGVAPLRIETGRYEGLQKIHGYVLSAMWLKTKCTPF